MNNLDLKNFKKRFDKGIFTVSKTDSGLARITQKRKDSDGDDIEPAVFDFALEQFDDVVLDNKAEIINQRKQINAAKMQIAAQEKALNEREQQLDKDASDLRKEIEKALAGNKK